MILVFYPSYKISLHPKIRTGLCVFFKNFEYILQKYFLVWLCPIIEIVHKLFILNFLFCCKLQTDKAIVNVTEKLCFWYFLIIVNVNEPKRIFDGLLGIFVYFCNLVLNLWWLKFRFLILIGKDKEELFQNVSIRNDNSSKRRMGILIQFIKQEHRKDSLINFCIRELIDQSLNRVIIVNINSLVCLLFWICISHYKLYVYCIFWLGFNTKNIVTYKWRCDRIFIKIKHWLTCGSSHGTLINSQVGS